MNNLNKYTKNCASFLLLLFFIISNSVHAQTSEGGIPPSFSVASSTFRTGNIPMFTLPPLDTASINQKIKEARRDCKDCRKDFYGKGFDIKINLIAEGIQQLIPSGTIWRYKIKAADALEIQLYFEKFELPDGGKLFIYNENKSMTLGAFTSKNNMDKGKFAIQPVKGNLITIEYFEPSNAVFNAKIEIFKVIHVFIDALERSGPYIEDAGAAICNVDVACPLGSGWSNEIRSVGLILYYDENYDLHGWCSGALINNTNLDTKPYFLTANHCVNDIGPEWDYFHWIILFNHQETTCGGDGSSAPIYQSISGANLLAKYSISDFAFLELHENIPASYNACFAGWDNTNAGGSNTTATVGIHHPKGDIKKISKDNVAPQSSGVYYTDTHWEVSWDPNQGITEGGSSGSPLFNSAHKIIGQFHLGTSSCIYPQKPDYYGKFSRAWVDGNLGVWLSPFSNTTTLNTYCPVYVPQCSNQVQDANETGIDCGGPCPKCPPTCSDGKQNGNETGIDCGGNCPPCAPTCFDYKKNGLETGVDCGGPCPACPVPSCTDHIKNQDETGIDCGGVCPPCSTLCSDEIHNGDEFEKDCGGSCAPCYSLVSDGGFEDLTCTPWTVDERLSFGFTVEDKCVAGNWYASHGAPAIRNWEDGTHTLRFYSNSWPLQQLAISDGLFYQFDSNLDRTKSYTLHFNAKVAPGESLDACEFYVTDGLQQSHVAQDDVWPDWNPPTYEHYKYRFDIWDGTWNYTEWRTLSIDFTVPNNAYNQLWIKPFQYTGNGPVHFYVDNVIVTVHSGSGAVCVPNVNHTNTSTIPSISEAINISAETAVSVLNGQTVRFKAETEISLKTGFSANAGSIFLAEITPCVAPNPLREKPFIPSEINPSSTTKPKASRAQEPTIAQAHSFTFNVQPNPGSGKFNINFAPLNKSSVAEDILLNVEIYNNLGSVISSYEKITIRDHLEINLENYPAGVYFIKVVSDQGVLTEKIILAK